MVAEAFRLPFCGGRKLLHFKRSKDLRYIEKEGDKKH